MTARRAAANGYSEGTTAFIPFSPSRYMTPVAREVQHRSLAEWGDNRMISIIGLSDPLAQVLHRIDKVSSFEESVLITGESGSGKEALAQAIYLLSPRRGRPCITVNCPQFQEGNLTVSELFGHTRGSFTGAIADRKGCFEAADGGVIFLDEIGDLHQSAQVMLLRALATGEFYPLGSTAARSVNVRVIAATNRDVDELRMADNFRDDLFFRLRYFHIELPPLRERHDDWALLVEYFLDKLRSQYGVVKSFSAESMRVLATHDWPGNVRELQSVVTTGYAMCDGNLIQPEDFMSQLMNRCAPSDGLDEQLWSQITADGEDFWGTVHTAFMNRDLNRMQVRGIVQKALIKTRGSYRGLLAEFNLPDSDYQKMMDFLRHHRLKP
jgi:DNA-binding NtrC family response regulator